MRRKYRIQEDPFNVSFELTLGCNLRCPMCAVGTVHAKPGKDYKFMEKSTLVRTVEQIKDLGWNCRIGFAMRGEPTLHPDYIGMVAAVREVLPKAHITMLTNGCGLLRKPGAVKNVTGLFSAGLNVLGMDHYTGIAFVPKIMESIDNESPVPLKNGKLHPLGFTFYKYPDDRAGNPHVRRPRNSRTLVRIRDIMEQDAENKTGTHSKVFNYAGLSYPPDDSMAGKRCHHPFRQIVVQWDGNIPGCCNDWRSAYNCGNVNDTSLSDIWQSNAFGAMREKLIRGERDFSPCKGCNHRSYRVGLLPDLMGQGKLHKPDAQTKSDITAVLSQGDHTPMINPPAWWKA
jgi:radical SAM protein with 4Fe4S-binding SPASM domain